MRAREAADRAGRCLGLLFLEVVLYPWLRYDMNFLAQAADETENPFTSGNIGLVIGNYEGGSDFTVAFDNIKVYEH
jgi:hypothetical protein